MNHEYTAVVKQDGDWWIGWIEEIPGVNCQERTREELIETLRVTLGEALELKWDQQIEQDSKAGRLDFLVREAAEAKKDKSLRDL